MTDERPRIALSDAPHQNVARRLVLELAHASDNQPDRWVLVHVLHRRLPLDAASMRGALAHGQARGWFEIDDGKLKRVRLLDAGRALIGGRQRHRRSRLPERR
jgi:hypothetical protein